METASTFDITHMTLEELSCRRMREEEEEDEDGDGEDDEGERREDDPGSSGEMASFFGKRQSVLMLTYRDATFQDIEKSEKRSGKMKIFKYLTQNKMSI